MIDRYSSPLMRSYWDDRVKFKHYLDVELASLSALEERHIISSETLEKLKKASFTLTSIADHEKVLRHDVLAFVEACRDSLGDEKRWFHFGLTSSDVIDTAHSLILKSINDHLQIKINQLLIVLNEKALAYQTMPIMARTHGMYAETTRYGLRYALWYDDLKRLESVFHHARQQVEVVKLSGSIGTYPILPIDHETSVATRLGLQTSPIHTQVIQRDRHAFYVFSLVNLSGLIEKIALDIRLLSRSEIMEVSEAFGSLQKGSSAMPHKRNPVLSENLMGLARLMRGYQSSVLENQALWHERDISHSSVERVVLMDVTTLMDYMLDKVTSMLATLEVRPESMQRHVNEAYGTYWTQVILHQAILKGHDRDTVYRLLQAKAFEAIETKTHLLTLLKEEKTLSDLQLDQGRQEAQLDQSVALLYQRVFNNHR